jgi:leucyl aminopeptidase
MKVEFGVASGRLEQGADCIVAGVYEGRRLSAAAMELDAAAHGALGALVGTGDLEGRAGTTLLLHQLPHLAAQRVLLVGLGAEHEFRESA